MEKPPHGEKLEYKEYQGVEPRGRKCQDVVFLLLFLAFWGGMIYVAVVAVDKGQPQRLIYGVDMFGNVCGTTNPGTYVGRVDATELKNLYWADLTDLDIQICVKECPKETVLIPSDPSEVVCFYNVDTVNKTGAELLALIAKGSCYPTYKSTDVLNRCFPFLSSDSNSTINDTEASNKTSVIVQQKIKDIGSKIFEDLIRAKWVIFGMSFMAFVLGFVWLLFLRLFAGFIVWLTIFLVQALFIAITYLVYANYQDELDDYEKIPVEQRIDEDDDNYKLLRVLFYVFLVITIIIFLLIVFMRNRIRLAISIIQEASKAMTAMPFITLFPIFCFILLLGFLIYWFVISMYLATAGEARYITDENGNENFAGFITDKTLRRMQLYHFFGLLWTTQFLLGTFQVSIAGAIASWYYARDKSDIGHFPVASSFGRTLRYHLGSIALGSLIIAIVQYIRAMINFMEKNLQGRENRVIRCLFRCLNCLFKCVERFLKFINKNAYILIAVYGGSFCSSAKRAFDLLLRNILRVAAVNSISAFLLFLGKLSITISVAITAMEMIKRDEDMELNYYAIVVLLIVLIAYFIASGFMELYDMAIDTILLCFCEDVERNDGSEERPYFMSDNLKEFISSSERQATSKVAPAF